MTIKLKLAASHKHIIPVLALALAALLVGAPQKALHTDSSSSVGGIAVLSAISIASYYFAMLFINFGHARLRISEPKSAQVAILIAHLITYFAFACRVVLLSAVEAILLATFFARFAVDRLNPFDHPAWTPYWWYSLAAVADLTHVVAERRNLGRAAVVVTGNATAPTVPEGTEAGSR